MKLPCECRVSGAPACRRCQFAGVAPLRSALHSYRTFTTRGRYFFGISGIVLFPAALVQNAAYKASLRVQSERSERLRELTAQALRRELTAQALRRELTAQALRH